MAVGQARGWSAGWPAGVKSGSEKEIPAIFLGLAVSPPLAYDRLSPCHFKYCQQLCCWHFAFGGINMLPAITVSTLDFKRIESVLDALPSAYDDVKDRLFAELDRAAVVEPNAVPSTLVTMNSRVCFTVLATGVTMVKTLVYPKDLAANENNISILTPLGSALLGLSVGQEIEWKIDAQKTMRVRIDTIEYQPERAGDFHL